MPTLFFFFFFFLAPPLVVLAGSFGSYGTRRACFRPANEAHENSQLNYISFLTLRRRPAAAMILATRSVTLLVCALMPRIAGLGRQREYHTRRTVQALKAHDAGDVLLLARPSCPIVAQGSCCPRRRNCCRGALCCPAGRAGFDRQVRCAVWSTHEVKLPARRRREEACVLAVVACCWALLCHEGVVFLAHQWSPIRSTWVLCRGGRIWIHAVRQSPRAAWRGRPTHIRRALHIQRALWNRNLPPAPRDAVRVHGKKTRVSVSVVTAKSTLTEK